MSTISTLFQDTLNVKYGVDIALGAADRYLETASTLAGVVDLVADRSVVEQDNTRVTTAGTAAFDTVSEVQALIADAINASPDAADKVLNVFYGFNTSTSQKESYIVASNMGSVDSSDLQASDDFSVMSLARVIGMSQGQFSSSTLDTD